MGPLRTTFQIIKKPNLSPSYTGLYQYDLRKKCPDFNRHVQLIPEFEHEAHKQCFSARWGASLLPKRWQSSETSDRGPVPQPPALQSQNISGPFRWLTDDMKHAINEIQYKFRTTNTINKLWSRLLSTSSCGYQQIKYPKVSITHFFFFWHNSMETGQPQEK